MTMNRLITSLIQLVMLGGVIVCVRLMWHDLKNDFKEMIRDFKK